MKGINSKETTFLTSYEKMQSLAQFGAELTAEVKKDLKIGDLIYKLLEQPVGMVVPTEVQLIMFSLIWTETITDITKIGIYRQNLIDTYVDTRPPKLFLDIIEVDKMDKLMENIKRHQEELIAMAKIEEKPAPEKPVEPAPEATPPATPSTDKPATPAPAQPVARA